MSKRMNEFFTVRFCEDNKGKIHIFTTMSQKDLDGYFLTGNQKHGMMFLIDKLKDTINNNSLEDLK